MNRRIKDTKKNKTTCAITKATVFILILFTCFLGINNIVKRKNAYTKTSDFFSQKQDFNVLFFGTSHVLNAVFPMQLWKDYRCNLDIF